MPSLCSIQGESEPEAADEEMTALGSLFEEDTPDGSSKNGLSWAETAELEHVSHEVNIQVLDHPNHHSFVTSIQVGMSDHSSVSGCGMICMCHDGDWKVSRCSAL
jgi:hypothetical protein